jgi:hypothetical protein
LTKKQLESGTAAMAISLNDLDARNGVEASGDEVDGSRAAATWAEKSRGMSWPKMRIR